MRGISERDGCVPRSHPNNLEILKMENDLLSSVCANGGASGELRRRVAAGNLYVEEFGCAVRIAGPGVDLIVARHTTITAADLEAATRSR